MGTQLTEEEELEAAIAALDQESVIPVEGDSMKEGDGMGSSDSSISPTLAALGVDRRPKVVTVCETCPVSLWFASPVELKCYCRAMYLVVWSTKDPTQITHCDGQFLDQD